MTRNDIKKATMTVREASQATGIAERTLRRRIAEGEIQGALNGHRWLIKVSSLARHLGIDPAELGGVS